MSCRRSINNGDTYPVMFEYANDQFGILSCNFKGLVSKLLFLHVRLHVVFSVVTTQPNLHISPSMIQEGLCSKLASPCNSCIVRGHDFRISEQKASRLQFSGYV